MGLVTAGMEAQVCQDLHLVSSPYQHLPTGYTLAWLRFSHAPDLLRTATTPLTPMSLRCCGCVARRLVAPMAARLASLTVSLAGKVKAMHRMRMVALMVRSTALAWVEAAGKAKLSDYLTCCLWFPCAFITIQNSP